MRSIEDIYLHCSALKSEALSLKSRYEDKKKVLVSLEKDREITIDAIELAKRLVNEDSEKFIKTLEGLLTMAVEKIFYDVDSPKVRIKVKEGVRNSANLFYEYVNHNGVQISSDIKKSVGGGVRCVVGFVLQVFFISYYKKNRVIFADEAFKELSKQYRPYFIEFLKELSIESGFKFLLITHDEDIVDNSDYIYKMENGKLLRYGGEL